MGTPDKGGAPAGLAERVVVLAPLGRDAAVVCRTLGGRDVACVTAGSIAGMVTLVREGAGAALLTEEALTSSGVVSLSETLAQQPSWSDLPVLLLLAGSERLAPGAARAMAALHAAGNVTILVRPVPAVALVTTVQAAIRARRRQYEVRDLMEREHAARLQAEHANQLKDEFLATVSHELRTPLSAILLWAKLAATSRLKAEQVPEALRTIERSAEAQSQLIDDLLDASRMVSGKLRLSAEECQLEPAVREAVEVVQPAAEAKGVRIEATLNRAAGVVLADPDRIRQVVWNLLSNAVKFTPRGGDVLIHLGREGDYVRIEVTDTGAGISAEFLPHVFDRFRQADASAGRRHGGLGLGLAITHQLIELHGGTITAESDGEGMGSTFIVRLPLVRTAAVRSGAPVRLDAVREPARALSGVRVLLVDDEAEIRLGMALVLEGEGAEVTAVGSAAEALKALEAAPARRKPHVLLSDIGLPGEDGYQLLDRVRAAEAVHGGEIPAVAVTAYAREVDRRRALDAGFQGHLAKPIEPDELIAAVAALVAGRAPWPAS